jgi:hypothetical protein
MEQLPWKDISRLIKAHKFPMCTTVFLKFSDDAVHAAASMKYPLYAKVYARKIVHKQAAGIVAEACSPDELPQALATIRKNAKKVRNAKMEGIILQHGIEPGPEVLIGMHRDEVFGPVVVFGTGGSLAKLADDVAVRIAPLSQADAEDMIAETRIHRISGQKLNESHLVALLLKMSAFAMKETAVKEAEFNPVIIAKSGPLIVDVRMMA